MQDFSFSVSFGRMPLNKYMILNLELAGKDIDKDLIWAQLLSARESQ